MSRVAVDRAMCASTGVCELHAPDVFLVGDDGALAVLQDPLDSDQVDAVREAVRSCPTRALQLQG